MWGAPWARSLLTAASWPVLPVPHSRLDLGGRPYAYLGGLARLLLLFVALISASSPAIGFFSLFSPHNDGVAMSNEFLNHPYGRMLRKLRRWLRTGKACA
jgi:hypothetical protein